MIEQKKDAPGNPPYWICTNCKWAFPMLREATSHQCGTENKAIPAFFFEYFMQENMAKLLDTALEKSCVFEYA
jgi:hypothetical protein